MMCYRDMTFCDGASRSCAKFSICQRALTDAVRESASKWWGSDNAPIARYADAKELKCYEPKKDETK